MAVIHVRRGDGKATAVEWEKTGYQVLNEHHTKAVAGLESTLVLPSDDPAVYSASEFTAHEPTRNTTRFPPDYKAGSPTRRS